MNELALFAGAGGGILASVLLRHNIVCAVERDEFCQSILVQRQNDGSIPVFPIWDDIRTFDGKPFVGSVDLVSGGFPCQAFSTAARGKNIAGKDLWGEMHRVILQCRAPWVFAENVSERAILQAERALTTDGYACARLKLSAADLGADHIRPRYWLLAYSNMYGKLRKQEHAKTQRVQNLRNGVWQTKPEEFRVPDGVAPKMAQLRAAGNGQVPVVAACAFIKLRDMLTEAPFG